MSVYDTSELKKGLKVTLDGQPYNIIYFQFVKPGKGQAFTRTKLKNMITGNVIERTFKSGEKLDKADLESREMQYLFKEGDAFVFMDNSSYEQIHISAEQLGENAFYLLDNTLVEVLIYQGRPIDVTPPVFVELKVTSTEPGFKGDTSGNPSKPAIMETGLKVDVPLFINEGETLRIDTRTGEYCERVNTKR